MIVLPVSMEGKDRCWNFAQALIVGNNQFNRFNQNEETQILRTYIGKLAELYFFISVMSLWFNSDMIQIHEII